MAQVEEVELWNSFLETFRRPVYFLSFLGAILGLIQFFINIISYFGIINFSDTKMGNSSDYNPISTDLISYRDDILRVVTTLSSLSIILVYLGTKWLVPNFRTLPFWAISFPGNFLIRKFSEYTFQNRSLNNFLVLVLVILHLLALFSPTLSLPLGLGFLTLSFLDIWRLFYHNYWIFAILSLGFPNPVLSHQIIIGSIYFWSGISKLFNKEFYKRVAPIIFVPLDSIPRGVSTFFALTTLNSQRLTLGFYFCGLLCETLMPIILFFSSIFGTTLRVLTLSFNLFFHFHISWVMGYPKGRWSWIPWNMWCLICTQICFSPYWSPNQYFLEISLSPFHMALTAIFFLVPISASLGVCPNYCLAHLYFAPGWIGKSYLFISKSDFETKFPKSYLGGSLPFITPPNFSETLPKDIHPALFELETFLKSKRFQNLEKVDNVLNSEISPRVLISDLVGIGNDWLNETYNVGWNDPFEEDYGPIRKSFAQEILRVRGITWGILLSEDDYSIFSSNRASKWSAQMIS